MFIYFFYPLQNSSWHCSTFLLISVGEKMNTLKGERNNKGIYNVIFTLTYREKIN